MINGLGQNLKSRRFGVKRLVAIGLPFLVAGLVMASGLNWTSPTVARIFHESVSN